MGLDRIIDEQPLLNLSEISGGSHPALVMTCQDFTLIRLSSQYWGALEQCYDFNNIPIY